MTRAEFYFKYKDIALKDIADAERESAEFYKFAGDFKKALLFAKQATETYKKLNDHRSRIY